MDRDKRCDHSLVRPPWDTRLGRWRDADERNLQRICTQIAQAHHGTFKAPWHLQVRSYRSPQFPSRNISTITAGDTCWILCEDPNVESRPTYEARAKEVDPPPPRPSHFKNTYLTMSPPNLPQFFQQLERVWSTRLPGAHADIDIMGAVYSIGDDLIVRVGKVVQKGEPRGLVIEAELVPMARFTGEEPLILQELITSITPNNTDIKAVSFNEEQWNEILASGETDESSTALPPEDEGIYAYGGEDFPPDPQDWTGANRDKRSAFLLLRLLVSESGQHR